MTPSLVRLRETPAHRFAGSERRIVLEQAAATRRAEAHDSVQKHRQVTLLHGPTLRLVLFAFDAGGQLPIRDAPGPVTLHGLRGSCLVRTPLEVYHLYAGDLILLDAGVAFAVDAVDDADILLSLSMAEGSVTSPPATDVFDISSSQDGV
ncbi:MAG TPA: hypothetical protein VGP84_14485 [Gemmatimonadaceae bacterium]|nr:hypothetical protein [Gemmatimonadaceae bacterium]